MKRYPSSFARSIPITKATTVSERADDALEKATAALNNEILTRERVDALEARPLWPRAGFRERFVWLFTGREPAP